MQDLESADTMYLKGQRMNGFGPYMVIVPTHGCSAVVADLALTLDHPG